MDPDALEAWAVRSDIVFVGLVERLGAPPTHWSGYLATYQGVQYRVQAVLKGALTGGDAVVHHAVVRNSPTAEPGDAPGLRADVFTPGARLLVMALRDASGGWVSMSERLGALAYTPELAEQATAALSRPADGLEA